MVKPAHHYIDTMFRCVISALLAACIGIAPAIANSCASACQMGAASMQHVSEGKSHSDATHAPDCHGQKDRQQEKKMPDGGLMVVACFVAASAAISAVSVPVLTIEIAPVQHATVLLPPLSFETSAPTKPPQA